MLRPARTAAAVLGVFAIVALVATVAAGFLTFLLDSGVAMLAAMVLGVATIMLFGARSAARPAHVVVQGGRLEVYASQGHYVFDLTSPYPPIEVVGRPAERSWQVRFPRRNMSPFVVDAHLVDPAEFMAVLRRYRPEVASGEVSNQ